MVAMLERVFLYLLIATATSWSQVTPSASGGGTPTQMMTPPPVSGIGFPTAVGAEVRSNYLRAGMTFDAAYVDHLYAGSGSTSIGETEFSVFPTIDFDTTSARQHATVAYNPGFTFYRPSSALNEVDNNAALTYTLSLTTHLTLSAADRFVDSSSSFNSTGGGVSGLTESSTPGAIPPFAKRLTNLADVELTMQTGLNVMVGGSGSSTALHYPDSAETPGLFDSSSLGGSVFYNHRISTRRYVGVTYQYQDSESYPAKGVSSTHTQTIMGYFTFYAGPKLSLSVSGGPQHYSVDQTPLATSASWGPSVSASVGWQGTHTNFAGSYSQSVTGGGGLLGAYHNRAAQVAARWQLSRTWTTGVSGTYFVNDSVTPLVLAGSANDHSLTGSETLEHAIGEQFSLGFNYAHVHQSYGDVLALSSNPDSDSETVSISWQFARPLGK